MLKKPTSHASRPFPLGAAVLLGATLLLGSTGARAENTWRDGEQVYAKVCGHCHEKGIGPVIKGRSLPPSYISAIVRHGFRAMPAFRASFIDDASLAAVAEFVGNSPAPAGRE
ncbi:MAG: cytochrome c [Oceanospirillaceae bacterium]|nr:cytochrome c [Oceanospirillaceae bacterium]